jgi:hypothetical protein
VKILQMEYRKYSRWRMRSPSGMGRVVPSYLNRTGHRREFPLPYPKSQPGPSLLLPVPSDCSLSLLGSLPKRGSIRALGRSLGSVIRAVTALRINLQN